MSPNCPVLPTGRLVGSQRYTAAERPVERFFDKTSIDDVDKPAGSATAVKQRRRPADDLDSIREQPLDGDLVIFTERGRVERVKTIGEHPDTLSELPANHRAR